MRRCCTFSTKRRRVRRWEWLTLLPCSGLRSQISQRPDIFDSPPRIWFLLIILGTFGILISSRIIAIPQVGQRSFRREPEHAMRVYHDDIHFGKSGRKQQNICQKHLLSNHSVEHAPLAKSRYCPTLFTPSPHAQPVSVTVS